MHSFFYTVAFSTAFTSLSWLQQLPEAPASPASLPVPTVATARPLKPKPGYTVIDLMPDFRKFWAQARDKDQATQVKLFQKMVSDPHPEVYNRDVLGGPPDQTFAATLPGRYPAIQAMVQPKMDLVLRISRQIGKDLPRYEKNFRKTFPDLNYNGRIYFMYSLGAFDGAPAPCRARKRCYLGST
ncbi:hypothetical protein [Hymenobacter sp. B1770]|uniref:hypothetical protein n=1 Tax=Hymenobacter sp. B1770 TaxID=1718788 RepID=UPI003CEC13E8